MGGDPQGKTQCQVDIFAETGPGKSPEELAPQHRALVPDDGKSWGIQSLSLWLMHKAMTSS